MTDLKPSRATITIGWDDVPWLDDQTKAEILASTPPHLRATVSRGVPTIGSGAIYPIPLDDILCEPFEIPIQDWLKSLTSSRSYILSFDISLSSNV